LIAFSEEACAAVRLRLNLRRVFGHLLSISLRIDVAIPVLGDVPFLMVTVLDFFEHCVLKAPVTELARYRDIT
jgi:hypothetical protein